jgi:hypothetical protein
MATVLTFNGSSYSVPAYNDGGWAQGTGNLSLYLVAIAAGTLQTTGGTFTLSAEVDFGSTYGLKLPYIKTATATPATAGVVRLALTDTICWGAANLALSVTGTALYFNGIKLVTTTDIPGDVTEYRYTFIAGTASGTYTGSLTLVNLAAAYVANGANLKVFVNGLLNAVTLDYAETSTTSFTFGSPLTNGDRIDALWTTF